MSSEKNVVSQYRFNGSGCLGTEMVGTPSYLKIGTTYRELCFKFDQEFSTDSDYYFTLKVKRDVSSDIDINLTLRREITNELDNDKSYQYLDTVHLPQWTTSDSGEDFIPVKRCALYATNLVHRVDGDASDFTKWNREDLRFSEVKEWKKGSDGYIDAKSANGVLDPYFEDKQLYFKEEGATVKYFLCRRGVSKNNEVISANYNGTTMTLAEGDNLNEWTILSSTLIAPSWRSAVTDDAYSVFDITFRPLVGGFNTICAEVERIGIDSQVKSWYEDASGKSELCDGRRLEVPRNGAVLREVTDLVPAMKKQATVSSITRIGVWGRPGLLMCINGEPIHVGHSSFYEQDSVTVESLGVVAQDEDWRNVFTIDYIGPADNSTGATH